MRAWPGEFASATGVAEAVGVAFVLAGEPDVFVLLGVFVFELQAEAASRSAPSRMILFISGKLLRGDVKGDLASMLNRAASQ
jgi:hypothetical protein